MSRRGAAPGIGSFTRRAPVAAALAALGTWAVCLAPAQAAPEAGCTPDAAVSMPAGRFVDHDDGTVTDRASKLMWMRCSVGQRWQAGRCAGVPGAVTWREAQQHADDVNLDGVAQHNDWRLPSLRELASITARECTGLRTNPAVFPGTAPAAYWSATPRAGDAVQPRVFTLGFGAEGVFAAGQNERHHLRLVRSGP